MGPKDCCVPNCTTNRKDNIILHCFPRPNLQPEKFRSWVYAIGGDILALDDQYIFTHRSVCHKHFEERFYTRSKLLSQDAIPTLHLPGWQLLPRPSISASKTEALGPLNVVAGGLKMPPTSERAKQRPNGYDRPSAKRVLNGTISPPGGCKKQRLDQIKKVASPTYAQTVSSPLSVAVTCTRKRRITKEVSELVLTGLQTRIFSDALARQLVQPPKFKAEPLYAEGVLNLWCEDYHTLTWLKRAVSEMVFTSDVKLVVKNQTDILLHCSILVPDPQGLLEDARSIGRVLSFQNPGVEVAKWTLINATKLHAAWFLVVGVPKDQVPTLLRTGCRLAFGVGTVYVKFQGRSGRMTGVPLDWDPSTVTVKQEYDPVSDAPEPSGEVPATASPAVLTSVEQESASIKVEAAEEVSISDLLADWDDVESEDLFAEFKVEVDEEVTTSNGVPFVEN